MARHRVTCRLYCDGLPRYTFSMTQVHPWQSIYIDLPISDIQQATYNITVVIRKSTVDDDEKGGDQKP